MKHIILSAGIAAVVAALIVTFYGGHTSPTPDQKESTYDRIMRTGEIRCAYGTAIPWLYKDAKDNQMKGYVYDLTNELGRRLSLKIVWDGGDVGWEQIVPTIQSGRADMACSTLWQSAARGRVLSFTRPLWYNQIRMYSRKDDSRFNDGRIETLNADTLTMPMVDGGESEQILETYFPLAKRLSMPPTSMPEDFFLALTTKKVDAVAVDVGVMNNFNRSHPGLIKEIPLERPLHVYPAAFAVAMGETDMRDMVDSAVAEMINTGYIERLLSPEIKSNPGSFLLTAPGYH